MTLPLFDQPLPMKAALGPRLRSLAARGVYFGTSSWKYEGWLDSIYTRRRYETRGRFSRKKFETECLAEYAETFPAVCGDFSFYQFPSPDYWQRLFTGLPPDFLFGFKVPEAITVKTWPSHARYGARGGSDNESFLDAGLFQNAFARPLEPYHPHVAVMIFEFGTFSKQQYASPDLFYRDLDRFLAALPGGYRYAVEVRNREFFEPAYFDLLRSHRAAHVFNAWTRVPPLDQQTAIEEAYTADFIVARALLSPGRAYEQAVRKFEPYERIQEPNEGARQGLRRLVARALGKKQLAFLFVNNRLEGNAPGTIQAVTPDD
ncbi:MAG: DUF72 domain-containing protein [Bryobacteraceae bacterium]|nr:DUF72 domain-containing protein [Bryobacteraceae bacterium]